MQRDGGLFQPFPHLDSHYACMSDSSAYFAESAFFVAADAAGVRDTHTENHFVNVQ